MGQSDTTAIGLSVDLEGLRAFDLKEVRLFKNVFRVSP